MSIPADLAKLTDEEVWVDLHYGMIDSPMHRQVILTLQPNNLDRQTRASRELVYGAGKLVSATARLADFTRSLRMHVGSGRTLRLDIVKPRDIPSRACGRSTFQTAADVMSWRRCAHRYSWRPMYRVLDGAAEVRCPRRGRGCR